MQLIMKIFSHVRTSAVGRGGGVGRLRTNADKGGGGSENEVFLRTSFMDDPLEG